MPIWLGTIFKLKIYRQKNTGVLDSTREPVFPAHLTCSNLGLHHRHPGKDLQSNIVAYSTVRCKNCDNNLTCLQTRPGRTPTRKPGTILKWQNRSTASTSAAASVDLQRQRTRKVHCWYISCTQLYPLSPSDSAGCPDVTVCSRAARYAPNRRRNNLLSHSGKHKILPLDRIIFLFTRNDEHASF